MPNTISKNELFASTEISGLPAPTSSKMDTTSANHSTSSSKMDTTSANHSTSTTTMATYKDLFTHQEISNNIITYYGKEEANDANWEKINTFLEEKWGDNGKNQHYKWRGFKIDNKFQTVFVKKPCNPHICECEECDKCGRYDCYLEEDDDGNNVCCVCSAESEEEEEEDE